MKIIYLANFRIPTEKAHGLQVIKTCEALAAAGNQVELVVPTRKNRPFKDVNIFKYYGALENFQIKKIRSYDPTSLMLLPRGFYIKAQILFFCASLFFYLFFKKDKKSYIFYTRDEHLLPLLLKFSSKVFWEAHNLPQNSKYYLKFWRRCAGTVAITQGLKNDLIKLGVVQDKIIVAPDGVDLNNFEIRNQKSKIREKLNLSTDKKIVMYTGHLYDWKGAQILAEAANFLDENIIVIFVGGTDFDLNDFRNKNKQLVAGGKILLLGQRPPQDIPEFLSAADCLVLPNSGREDRSAKYTSPLKLFEYLAAGGPIVASDLPSIREILNENNAVLVPPDNPCLLAENIEKVLQNNGFSAKIRAQAKLDAKSYTWQKRVDKIVNFLSIHEI
jgi:glycosyltransferase involved in cell wall biosynthesis